MNYPFGSLCREASFSRSSSVGGRTSFLDRRVAASSCDNSWSIFDNMASFSRSRSVGSRTILFDFRLFKSDGGESLRGNFSNLVDVLGIGGAKSKSRERLDDDDEDDEPDLGFRLRFDELEFLVVFRFFCPCLLTEGAEYWSSSSDQSPYPYLTAKSQRPAALAASMGGRASPG